MNGPAPPRPAASGWPTRLLAALTAGYTCLLAWATHYPKPEELLGPDPPSDKLMHVVAYAVLATLVFSTLAVAGRLSGRALVVAAACLAAFAVVDEATQPLPWFRRTADPLDWVFDMTGVALGLAVVLVLRAALGRLRAA